MNTERQEWLERLGSEGFRHWKQQHAWSRRIGMLMVLSVCISSPLFLLPLFRLTTPPWLIPAVIILQALVFACIIFCMVHLTRHLLWISRYEAQKHGSKIYWNLPIRGEVNEYDGYVRKKLQQEERRRARQLGSGDGRPDRRARREEDHVRWVDRLGDEAPRLVRDTRVWFAVYLLTLPMIPVTFIIGILCLAPVLGGPTRLLTWVVATLFLLLALYSWQKQRSAILRLTQTAIERYGLPEETARKKLNFAHGSEGFDASLTRIAA